MTGLVPPPSPADRHEVRLLRRAIEAFEIDLLTCEQRQADQGNAEAAAVAREQRALLISGAIKYGLMPHRERQVVAEAEAMLRRATDD